MTVIELVDVDKVYPGTVQVHALRGVNRLFIIEGVVGV